MYGKYLHLLCDLSFHFVPCAFCRIEVLPLSTTKINSLFLYGLDLLCVEYFFPTEMSERYSSMFVEFG